MKSVHLAGALVGTGHPVWIISEIGGNFKELETAIRLVDLSIAAGADAVKLQTYRAETIASRKAVYDMPNVGNANQFDLFKEYEIDFVLHREIWDYCAAKGIPVFSTPSHMTDVELLERLDCPIYKIGSDDAWNIPFLKEVAKVGKPMVLSTGMCTMQEVRESVSAILGTGNDQLVLLHCITNYPADPEDTNLTAMQSMQREFGLPVGYSDHTLNADCCLAAVALGANVLEKHFTYDKGATGPDHMLSADPDEFRAMVESVRRIEKALGDGVKRPAAQEAATRLNNRKSVVSVVDIPRGTVITREMIALKRPGFGIQPKYFDQVHGRTACRDIVAETPVTWDDV